MKKIVIFSIVVAAILGAFVVSIFPNIARADQSFGGLAGQSLGGHVNQLEFGGYAGACPNWNSCS
jgi:hypothetical protein